MGEINQINNNELKEYVANVALEMLVEGEDYNEFDGITCEFGYIFSVEDHGLEALFKITTDMGPHYFAAQGSSLSRLSINEEIFRSTTENVLSMH